MYLCVNRKQRENDKHSITKCWHSFILSASARVHRSPFLIGNHIFGDSSPQGDDAGFGVFHGDATDSICDRLVNFAATLSIACITGKFPITHFHRTPLVDCGVLSFHNNTSLEPSCPVTMLHPPPILLMSISLPCHLSTLNPWLHGLECCCNPEKCYPS
jgi:hypothetical protein